MQLSERIRGFKQSEIRRMSRECARVGGINLGQGICDLPTIEPVKQGAIEAIEESLATYSRMEGIDLLRERIAAKCRDYNRFEIDPEDELVVTIGSTGGFAAAVLATLNPGDEVILFEPYYGYHLHTLELFGIATKIVPLEPPDWSIDLDRLRSAFSEKTRGIVVCTPSNPCGKVFSRDELDAIGALSAEFGAWIYTDEIYEYIVYDGREHVSMASLGDHRERTITISGFSKTFSITGWRIGYVAAPREAARAIGLVNDLLYVCAPTPLQWGVANGLTIGDEYYDDLAASYQTKRDRIVKAVAGAGMVPYPPQGAYYLLADVSSRFGDGHEAARQLLEQAGVASVPGSAFYRSELGARMLRFCFAKDTEELEEACRRIESHATSGRSAGV